MNPKDITILLVDDEPKFLDPVAEKIRLRGFQPLTALSGEEALKLAKHQSVDIAIVDQKMPGMDGLTTITKLKELHPQIKTVLLTGHGNDKVKQAAEALESAYFEKDEMKDFWSFIKHINAQGGVIIIKPPFGDDTPRSSGHAPEEHPLQDVFRPEELEMQAARQSLERQRSRVHPEGHGRFSEARMQKLIGETPGILELKRNIRKVACLDCTVLILGETGTGKELVARAIHMLSPRNAAKFMAVNCGSFAEDLLSNELFGHEREAFTGALHRKRGVFEAASGGTILLDEIGDTPLSMQVKLLRVLEEKVITRVGGTEEIPIDVRILAATNQSLKRKLSRDEFREDLYYRLDTFILRLPPLRERKDDIPLLTSYFLDKYRREYDKNIKRISDEALTILKNHAFPGNVRELENAIERAVIVCEDHVLQKSHLPERFARASTPYASVDHLLSLAELEKQHIVRVLQHTGGNKSEAARILGINRASLWRKLKEINPK